MPIGLSVHWPSYCKKPGLKPPFDSETGSAEPRVTLYINYYATILSYKIISYHRPVVLLSVVQIIVTVSSVVPLNRGNSLIAGFSGLDVSRRPLRL